MERVVPGQAGQPVTGAEQPVTDQEPIEHPVFNASLTAPTPFDSINARLAELREQDGADRSTDEPENVVGTVAQEIAGKPRIGSQSIAPHIRKPSSDLQSPLLGDGYYYVSVEASSSISPISRDTAARRRIRRAAAGITKRPSRLGMNR
jgi:hypothetical protein